MTGGEPGLARLKPLGVVCIIAMPKGLTHPSNSMRIPWELPGKAPGCGLPGGFRRCGWRWNHRALPRLARFAVKLIHPAMDRDFQKEQKPSNAPMIEGRQRNPPPSGDRHTADSSATKRLCRNPVSGPPCLACGKPVGIPGRAPGCEALGGDGRCRFANVRGKNTTLRTTTNNYQKEFRSLRPGRRLRGAKGCRFGHPGLTRLLFFDG